MYNALAFIGILLTHAGLTVGVVRGALKANRPLLAAHLVWIGLVPLFGPISAWLLLSAPQGVHTASAMGILALKAAAAPHQMNVEGLVPLEEALLINDPRRRRALMMHALRSGPMQYLDLLLIARFNEDTETAHYATATIMELQRHFQMQLQGLQAGLSGKEPEGEAYREYMQLLHAYCQSGLLEGPLLMRQRLILKNALGQYKQLGRDPEILRIQVRNALALEDQGEARDASQRLMTGWPLDETSWLEAMRVCVETRDQQGMQALMTKMRYTPVDFSADGRAQLQFWKDKGYE